MTVHESDYIQTPCACGSTRIFHDDARGYSRGVRLGPCMLSDCDCQSYEVVRTLPDPAMVRFRELLQRAIS